MVMVNDVLWMDFCRAKNFKFFVNFDVGEKTENVIKTRIHRVSRNRSRARLVRSHVAMDAVFARFLLSYNE